MEKMETIQDFVTLEKAVEQVSKKLKETINLSDILRAALDGHLRLSVRFLSDTHVLISKVPALETDEDETDSENLSSSKDIEYGTLTFSDSAYIVDGVWPLVMESNGEVEIENRYLHEIGESQSISLNQKGTIYLHDGDTVLKLLSLKDEHTKAYFEYEELLEQKCKALLQQYGLREVDIIDKINEGELPCEMSDKDIVALHQYYMSEKKAPLPVLLPSTSLQEHQYHLVVRRNDLQQFITRLINENKPLTPREKNTLLILWGAALSELGYKHDQTGIAGSLTAMTDRFGATVGEDTIRKRLKEIDAALDSRNTT
ncbi:TPA: hypothetical protein NBT51_003486 [Vibrio parahaemolyticus]|nr:hypothetical protein [Vibrio parahaemolyticus]